MEKILFITYGFNTGGAETFLVNLLNRLDKSIIKPLVVSIGPGTDLENKLDPDIKITRVLKKWKYDIFISKKIAEIIINNNVQKVFVMSLYCYFFLFLAKLFIKKPLKIFISVHSTKPRSIKDYLLNMFYSRLLSGKEKIVSVCNNQAEYLSRTYHINKRQFQTIYNGVDTEYFTMMPETFSRKAFREKYNIPEQAHVIVQVASFRKEKGHKYSFEALKIYNKKNENKAYLLLVGGGNKNFESKLKILAQELNILGYIKFCGIHPDVRQFYWSSDLFTLSSLSETFSIAALEAMSCGLPCVLTNVGGANEMVVCGFNGELVGVKDSNELAEKWNQVLSNIIKYNPQKIRYHIIKNFSFSECFQRYQKLL